MNRAKVIALYESAALLLFGLENMLAALLSPLVTCTHCSLCRIFIFFAGTVIIFCVPVYFTKISSERFSKKAWRTHLMVSTLLLICSIAGLWLKIIRPLLFLGF